MEQVLMRENVTDRTEHRLSAFGPKWHHSLEPWDSSHYILSYP